MGLSRAVNDAPLPSGLIGADLYPTSGLEHLFSVESYSVSWCPEEPMHDFV